MGVIAGMAIGFIGFLCLISFSPNNSTTFSVHPDDAEQYIKNYSNRKKKRKTVIDNWLD